MYLLFGGGACVLPRVGATAQDAGGDGAQESGGEAKARRGGAQEETGGGGKEKVRTVVLPTPALPLAACNVVCTYLYIARHPCDVMCTCTSPVMRAGKRRWRRSGARRRRSGGSRRRRTARRPRRSPSSSRKRQRRTPKRESATTIAPSPVQFVCRFVSRSGV